MTEQPKASYELTKAANEATSFQDLRETVLKGLAAEGVIVRSRTDEFNNQVNPNYQPEPLAPAVPQAPAKQTSVRVIYPHLNDRFEIYGASETELDEKERQIRAMFGSAR